MRHARSAWSAVALVLAGCSGGAIDRGAAATLDPEASARQALDEYDANKDSFLDAGELERCPALKSCLPQLDKDGDQRLSAREIADRLAYYHADRLGRMAFGVEVSLDGSPLAGATVTFVPEKFLGSGYKPAAGVTGKNGVVDLQVEGETAPGIPCGLYRVTVSKKDAKGKELVPARYNEQTTLGQEVAPDLRGGVFFRLTSKGKPAAAGKK